jgi:hypothetical protein
MPQGVAVLQTLGATFVVLLVDLSGVFLFVFIGLFWLLFVIWILRNELVGVAKWILAIRIDFANRTVTFPEIKEIKKGD